MKRLPRYFYLCLVTMILASSVGLNWALSYGDLTSLHLTWSTIKPTLGIMLLFTSLILNWIGYAGTFNSRRASAEAPRIPTAE